MTAIEKLYDEVVVYEGRACVDATDESEQRARLQEICRELMSDLKQYFDSLVTDEDYLCSFIFPGGIVNDSSRVCISQTNIKEYTGKSVAFPFGTVTENLWLKLIENKDNVFFKLIKYLEFYTDGLQNLLIMHGVEELIFLSLDMMIEEDIYDVMGLYRIAAQYYNAYKYLDKPAYVYDTTL